jgi:methionyl-tRNA synthetase
MIERFHDSTVPETGETMSLDTEGSAIIEAYAKAMDQHLLHIGGQEAWQLVSRANGFVEESAPWNLAKSGEHERLAAVLAALARAVARITLMAAPFMPTKTQQVWNALGLSGAVAEAQWSFLQQPKLGGATVTKGEPVFPKISRSRPAEAPKENVI